MARRTIFVSLLGAVALLIANTLARTPADASSGNDSVSFLFTAAKTYEPLAWIRGAERFAAGATIMVRDAWGQHALLGDFVASADPAVSFDGRRVLFAGRKKAGDPWQIWEVALDGSLPRRITNFAEDCVRPLYLPEDRVVYARRVDGRFVIEAMNLTGGKALALTYGPANFLPTDILRDGRILFAAGYPLGSDATPEVYTVYSDGSGMESYRCDHGKARGESRQLGSGEIVFASTSGLARFTPARAQEVPIAAPAGDYAGDVAETPAGVWLVPWRKEEKAQFQLMRWTPGAPRLAVLVSEPGLNVIQPAILAARAIPNRHPSGLHDWPNANLLCLNAYTSKYSFAAGSIRSVRMYVRESSGNTKVLGTAPVESDGSFFVQVPTERALQIELLDGSGNTLKREAGFFWMRRGEQRACVGCHAGPETAPENAVPQILLRSTTPADMTSGSAANLSGGH